MKRKEPQEIGLTDVPQPCEWLERRVRAHKRALVVRLQAVDFLSIQFGPHLLAEKLEHVQRDSERRRSGGESRDEFEANILADLLADFRFERPAYLSLEDVEGGGLCEGRGGPHAGHCS